MPSLRISIQDDPTSTVVHRFQNFGEDVYRLYRDVYDISIDEIDSSVNSLGIPNVKRREIKRVSEEIERLLKQHGFTGSVAVVEAPNLT